MLKELRATHAPPPDFVMRPAVSPSHYLLAKVREQALFRTQERAGQLVAGAMRALLPAVDANDEAKTLAVLRFFCVVLSSVPRLEVRWRWAESPFHVAAAPQWAMLQLTVMLLHPGALHLPQHTVCIAGSLASGGVPCLVW